MACPVFIKHPYAFISYMGIEYINLMICAGDCNKCIHLWEPTSNSWNVDTNPFVGHTASVEDLQACH
jgi:hypothetical protein